MENKYWDVKIFTTKRHLIYNTFIRTPWDRKGVLLVSEFGEKIKNLRTERGLTVKELCHQVGIPQSRLSELERGVRLPTSGQINSLEKYFGVASEGLAE